MNLNTLKSKLIFILFEKLVKADNFDTLDTILFDPLEKIGITIQDPLMSGLYPSEYCHFRKYYRDKGKTIKDYIAERVDTFVADTDIENGMHDMYNFFDRIMDYKKADLNQVKAL